MPSSSIVGMISASGSSPKRIFALQRRDRLHRMGAANGLRAGFGQAEPQHLAFGDQVLHRSGHILHRHVGIDPMLVVEIDMIGAQALEAALDGAADLRRPAVDAAAVLPVS